MGFSDSLLDPRRDDLRLAEHSKSQNGQGDRGQLGQSAPSAPLLCSNFGHCGFGGKEEAHCLPQVIGLERPADTADPTSVPHEDRERVSADQHS